MKFLIILFLSFVFILSPKSADAADADWKCALEVVNSNGISEKQSKSFKVIEALDFEFKNPENGELDVIFVNNSDLHFMGSRFYVNDSMPQIKASYSFSTGTAWIMLDCKKKN